MNYCWKLVAAVLLLGASGFPAAAQDEGSFFRLKLDVPLIITPPPPQTHSCMVEGSQGYEEVEYPIDTECPPVPTKTCATYTPDAIISGSTDVPAYEDCTIPTATLADHYGAWRPGIVVLLEEMGVDTSTIAINSLEISPTGRAMIPVGDATVHMSHRMTNATAGAAFDVKVPNYTDPQQCLDFMDQFALSSYSNVLIVSRLSTGNNGQYGIGTSYTGAARQDRIDTACNQVGTTLSSGAKMLYFHQFTFFPH